MSNDKNNFDDDFEDLFSSSSEDEFEDISSNDDGFEDFFTGREEKINEVENDYDFDIPVFNIKRREPVEEPSPVQDEAEPVEVRPYSYNYTSSNRKIKREAMDEVYEDINSGNQGKPSKDRKKISGGKIAGIVIASLLALVLIVTGSLGAYVYSYANKLLGKVNYVELEENKFISSSELFHVDGVRNILLIGVDARENEDADKTRSDTMMIVSIDSTNKQIKLTSILRDSYVQIAGTKNWNKINSSMSKGGVQLLTDTIEYNFKIDIDNYMFVTFEMFTSIVDKLGGIDVEVTEKESNYTYNSLKFNKNVYVPVRIDPGESVHLNGEQALWYCRIRYLDSDFMRTKRQRKVISAIFDQVKEEKLSTLMQMGMDVAGMVQTDLSSEEIKELALNIPKYFKYDTAQHQIPADDTWKSQNKGSIGSCLVMDIPKNNSLLKDFISQKAQIETPTETTTAKK